MMDVGLSPGTSTSTTNVIPSPISASSLVSDTLPRFDRVLANVGLTTFVSTGIFTVGSTTVVSNGQTSVIPVTSMGTLTVTTEAPIATGIHTSTQSAEPRASHDQTKVIVGGAIGAAAGIILLGLIIFFILRHKRRYKASHSISGASIPSNVPRQCLPQSTQLSTTPQPFLDIPVMQNYSHTKAAFTGRAKTLPVQNSLGELANPFRDPAITEGNVSNNEGEGKRIRNALDNLRALTSHFEGELQQLGALAQSGQLSTDDRLKLEEIRRTTGLTIQLDSQHNRFSIVRSASSASSPSFAPPSYHTRSD